MEDLKDMKVEDATDDKSGEGKEISKEQMEEENKFQKELDKSKEELNQVPTLDKPIEMKLLQFQCEACGLKTYINFEDMDKVEEFAHCPKCKGEAKRTRIFDITVNMFNDYDKVMEEYK